VRKSGQRVRISGHLIDASSGNHIWADRFDGALDDIFDLQDRVASSVVGSIEPRLRLSEIERASRKPTESLDAYDLYLRALAQVYRFTEEGFHEAVVLARQALRRKPRKPIYPHRAGDVLDLLVPEILETVRHAIPHLFEYRAASASNRAAMFTPSP
jgi:hypothetical protein